MTLGLPSIRPIPADALPALLAYKYNAIDRSLLSKYVLQPYWTWLVQFVPSWVAPNLVTLTGLLFIVANVLTLWALTGLEMESSGPAWMYYWFGLGLFAYTSLDAIDGKQARKTNTSGPLGELFDHGCDAINTFLGTIIITHVTGVQNSWWHLAYLFIGTSYFFLVTWETYHTGTLALGIINGPVEGTMLLTFFFLMTGYTGREIFLRAPVPSDWLFPFVPTFLQHLPYGQLVSVVFMIGSLLMMCSGVSNMLKQSREFGNSPGKALQRLVPFFSLTAFSLVFMHYGATGGVFQGVLVKRHMLAFTFAFGFDFSQLVARVILAHLTRSPKSYPGGILSHIGSLIPITGAVGALFGLFGGTPEADDRAVQWLYIWLALSTLHYAFMVWAVINQICNFLGVGCLRIVRRPSGNYHRRSQQRMAAAAAAASASSSSVASAGSTVFPPASRLDSRRAHA